MLRKLILPEVIWSCCSISLFNRSCHPQGRGRHPHSSQLFPEFLLFPCLTQKVTEGTLVLIPSTTLITSRNILLFYNNPTGTAKWAHCTPGTRLKAVFIQLLRSHNSLFGDIINCHITGEETEAGKVLLFPQGHTDK